MLQTPPMIIPLQQETRGVLPYVHWVYRTVISGTQPIIIPLQQIALGGTYEVHLFFGPLSIFIIHDFPVMNDTTHSNIPPTA